MNFKEEVERSFHDAILGHQLQVRTVDNSEVLLVGKRFALSISHGRDGVEIGYVEVVGDGKYSFLSITRFLGVLRFLPEDRALFGAPGGTVDEQIRASLRVISSGVTNRCSDILEGEKSWLDSLRKKDPAAYKGEALSVPLLAAMSSINW